MKKKHLFLVFITVFFLRHGVAQNIGINNSGALPDPKAMLDISSTTSGLLIPRMTTAQRNLISTPPVGLYIYNLDTKTLDVYNGTAWESIISRNNVVVLVKSLADLPQPVSGGITLVTGRTYLFSGVVNISPNYINLNGSAVMGQSPLSDAVASTVSGGILRSTDQIVHVQQLTVSPLTSNTTAFDFTDNTQLHTCALLTGTTVRSTTGTSLGGVGQISGFRDAIVLNNLWDVPFGIKFTGALEGLVFSYNIVHGLAAGPAIEFLPALTANDVAISGNQFDYEGSTVIKLNTVTSVDFGRVINNGFRGPASSTLLSGFNSFTVGWEMSLNTGGIPNSHSYGYSYMDGNTTATIFTSTTSYHKILGTTTVVASQKFTESPNRFTYVGKRDITPRVFVVIGCKSPAAGSDYTLVVAKNGVVIPEPSSRMGPVAHNQGFQIVLETEVSLATNDYLEVFIRSNAGTTSLVVAELQFRVIEQ